LTNKIAAENIQKLPIQSPQNSHKLDA